MSSWCDAATTLANAHRLWLMTAWIKFRYRTQIHKKPTKFSHIRCYHVPPLEFTAILGSPPPCSTSLVVLIECCAANVVDTFSWKRPTELLPICVLTSSLEAEARSSCRLQQPSGLLLFLLLKKPGCLPHSLSSCLNLSHCQNFSFRVQISHHTAAFAAHPFRG